MTETSTRTPLLRAAEIFILALILLLAAYLRLTNVSENPGWYTDEGTWIEIAQHLSEGRVQYMAINQSVLLFGRPPLFVGLLAFFFTTGGEGIQTLRILTGLLGVLSVLGLWWFVRRAHGALLALLAAVMLAIYTNAIIYNRIGFSYNLLTPFVLLAAWGMWEYLGTQRRRWLALAALAIGLGGLCDLMILNLLLPLVLVVLARRWRDLLWSIPLAGTPFVAYVLISLLTIPSNAFLFDLQFTFGRLNRLSFINQLAAIPLNLTSLWTNDVWMIPGIIGLFLLPSVRLKRLTLLLFLVPLITLARTVTISGISYYYITPLLPFIALGMASLVYYGIPFVFKTAQDGFERITILYLKRQPRLRAYLIAAGTVLVVFVLVVAPFMVLTGFNVSYLDSGFSVYIDSLLLDPDAARAVAVYVNEHIRTDESVIASPGIGWIFNANVADFQMMVAYEGLDTVHLPADLPRDRYAFDPRYSAARFFVIDNLWVTWAIPNNPPRLGQIVEDVQENWPLVFEAGKIRVYENPNLRGN
ncbi:MAG: glycosyltransferase family 39 protein [Chloroflexi bacterium]|nr:glycosyltransferase family 39 protein [Chloroflexota bacterium]